MIKLYDDQKIEILNDLKKFHKMSVKNVEELKEKEESEIFSHADIEKYESANEDMSKLIEKAENDLNSFDDRKWIYLLFYISSMIDKEESLKKDKKFDSNSDWTAGSNAWWGIIGLIAVAVLFGLNPKDFDNDIKSDSDTKN